MTRMFLTIPMWTDEERDELGAGKALMSGIQRDLCQAGFQIFEGVESWDDYGWSLVVDHRGTSVWCMVQASDDWLFQCWPHTGLMDRLRKRDVAGPCREVMDAILATLMRQRSVEGAKWLSEAEFKAG